MQDRLAAVGAVVGDGERLEVAAAVAGEGQRLVERRADECAEGVAFVMVDVLDLAAQAVGADEGIEFAALGLVVGHLVGDPLAQVRQALGTLAGFLEDPVQVEVEVPPGVEPGVPAVGDAVDVGQVDAGLAEHIVDGAARPGLVVLLAGEALLAGGGDDPAVAHQAGAGQVVVGDPENDHAVSSCANGWGARGVIGCMAPGAQQPARSGRLRNLAGLPDLVAGQPSTGLPAIPAGRPRRHQKL